MQVEVFPPHIVSDPIVMHAQLYVVHVLLLVRGECCMLNTQALNSTNATAAVANPKVLRCLTAELLRLAQPDCIAVLPLPFLARYG